MKKIVEVVNLYINRNPHRVIPVFNLRQLGIDGFRELSLTSLSTTSIKVKEITVSNGIALMPDDFVDYFKVGVAAGNQLWTLTVNNDLLGPQALVDECGLSYEEARTGGTVNQGYWFVPHVDKNGQLSGGAYAMGGGWNSKGYFKVDHENRRFLLDGVNSSTIVLEYKSNELSADTLVPDIAIEALIAWLAWKEASADQVSLGIVQMMKKDYQEQLDKVQALLNPFRVDEYLDIYYRDIHQGVKR